MRIAELAKLVIIAVLVVVLFYGGWMYYDIYLKVKLNPPALDPNDPMMGPSVGPPAATPTPAPSESGDLAPTSPQPDAPPAP